MSIETLEGENTQLKTANLKLQDQVKLMQTIFDSLSEGVVATNLEGEFLVANPSAQEMSGMAPVETAPEEWSETYGTFYPDKTTPVPSTELPLYKAMRGETTDDVKLVLRNQNKPEGVFVSVSGRPLYDETGALVGGVIAMRDVTELEGVTNQLEATIHDLQTQNNLMDTVLNSISNGVIVTNAEGEFLYFNPVAEKIVGIGATEADPEEWERVYGTFYPDKVTPFPSTELPLYKTIQGEIVDDVEVFIRNQNKPEGVFISVGGRPLYDQSGSLIGGVVVFHDITQLKKSAAQLERLIHDLQTQNSLMDAIFNSISDGVIVANKDGKYVLFNKTAREMAGQDIEDVPTSQAPEKFGLFRPDTEEFYPVDELPIARAVKGEHADNVEILIRNPQVPDGVHASISGRPIYDGKGVVNGAVAAIRDITSLKTAEKQLQVTNDQLKIQRQLLHSIFANISDGVIVVGRTSNVMMANQMAKRIIGPIPFIKSSDEWFKPNLYFYPDKVTPLPMEEHPIFKAIWGKSTDNVEMFIRNAESSDEIYASVSSRPLQDSDGTYTGCVTVFHDITDSVNAREALGQAFEQGRLEIMDTILHNIGNAINSVSVGIDTIHHQLTNDKLTPRLSALANAIEQHQDNFSDYVKNDPQGQKVLPFILTLAADFNLVKQQWEETVERIRSRTSHIVDIIRTQNSYQGARTTRKDINLKGTILDAIKILQDSIDKRQIQIEIDCGNAPKEIRIQESQFHQMLVNIIKNSVEAIDELGKLGERTEAPRIQIHSHILKDSLCIDITDNGIGIDAKDIKQIFSAGFTSKEHGSGLGLHSSANFIISTGGKIQACSDGKGQGATIRILLRLSSIQRNGHENNEEQPQE